MKNILKMNFRKFLFQAYFLHENPATSTDIMFHIIRRAGPAV